VPDQVISPVLLQSTDSSKGLLSFPYDNYIPIGLGRQLIAPVLQAYAADTASLQQKYVDVLAAQKSTTEILYGIDGISTASLDNVMFMTRLPIIFDYIYANFEAAAPVTTGEPYVLLRARPAVRTDMTSDTLDYTLSKLPDGTLKLALAQPANCSLIQLGTRIDYPVTAFLGRPNPLNVTVYQAGSPLKSSNLETITPGETFDTYFQLIDPPNFAQVFGNGPVQAQMWDTIQIKPVSTGFLEVYPSSVEVTHVRCVNFQRTGAFTSQIMMPLTETTSDFHGVPEPVAYTNYTVDGSQKRVFFQHPPSTVNFHLNLPKTYAKAAFVTSAWIDPSNLVNHPDVPETGAVFRISIIDENGQTKLLSETVFDPQTDRYPIPITVNLQPYIGQNATLVLQTALRNNNSNYAWAMWIEPAFSLGH
jgi:hypothetical protein